MTFDKAKFKICLRDQGLSQADLATMLGIDVRTVRRWLSPKEPLSAKTARKMCEALQKDPAEFDPDWSPADGNGHGGRVGAAVSASSANGYELLRRRYGVSKKQILEIAPVLFAVIAERALRRGQRLEAKMKNDQAVVRLLKLDHMLERNGWAGEYYEFLYIEKAKVSAEQGWVFGASEDEVQCDNLFRDEIADLLEEQQDDWVDSARDGTCPQSIGFDFARRELREFAGGEVELMRSISMGEISLSKMEDHLWEEVNREERLRWLRQQAKSDSLRRQRIRQTLLRNLDEKNPRAASIIRKAAEVVDKDSMK